MSRDTLLFDINESTLNLNNKEKRGQPCLFELSPILN